MPAEIAKKLSTTNLLPAPPGWLKWLETGKCVAKTTAKLYSHCIRQFLGVMKILAPHKSPTLKMAWNVSLCSTFLDTMANIVNRSTLVNYQNALISARTYLRRLGKAPEDATNRMEDFRDSLKKAIRLKRIHVNQRKEEKQGSWGILWLFNRRIYYGIKLLQRFYKIADRFKLAKEENKDVRPLSRLEWNFCNGYIMLILTGTNYHRSGNLALIEYEAAKREILRARKVLGKLCAKGLSVNLNGRHFDRRQCEPAVIKVEGGTKLGGVVKYVVLSPRDQDLMVKYFRLRDNFPRPITTSKLFVNARGDSVAKNVSSYIYKIGKMVGIKDFSCQMLRSLMETENVLDESNPERNGVSTHMGHTTQTRQDFYVLRDSRHCVQASNRLLAKLEEIGDIENPQVKRI